MIAAEQGGAPAPAAASGDRTVLLDDEIGAIVDQLRVEAHHIERRLDSLGRKEAALQLPDRGRHQIFQHGNVVAPCEAMGERHAVSGIWKVKRVSTGDDDAVNVPPCALAISEAM